VPENLETQAPHSPTEAPAGGEGGRIRHAARRWGTVAAWVAGCVALFELFLRISLNTDINSDGAADALQGWAMLHGNLLLSGWQLGDVNYYFLELPLNAITTGLFGLGDFANHVASALTYLLVAVCAVALAVTGSRGTAKAARVAVVIMVLAAPLLAMSVQYLLEEPDHIGTSVFVLLTFLLIELSARAKDSQGESSPPWRAAFVRRFAAPLVGVILWLGQSDDATVRYVAVPAVVLVCGYRALAARKLRSLDSAFVAAAVLSVPMTSVLNAVKLALGGFTTSAPLAHVSSPRLWPHQAVITWNNIRLLFGAAHEPTLSAAGFGFTVACLLVAIAGFAWAACRWPRVSRAEQMLCVAIACNVGVDMVSELARAGKAHELAVVLPCSAVLAARLVPARIITAPVAFAAVASTALAAVLPLVSAASLPEAKPFPVPLTSWLEAHGLTYGLAGYWDAAAPTLQTGGKIQLRTTDPAEAKGRQLINASNYEIDTSWYNPALHDATFVVADPHEKHPAAPYERVFGKPVQIQRIDGWIILIYRTNLLRLLHHPGARVPRNAPAVRGYP
jgi:hypothetical protein